MSLNPQKGFVPVYFHEQYQTTSSAQYRVDGTIFIPDNEGAFLIFMDDISNTGKSNGSDLKRWTPEEADRFGLVPMVVYFDGTNLAKENPLRIIIYFH